MKNRRNTRRGRAKRWARETWAQPWPKCTWLRLRGTEIRVAPEKWYAGGTGRWAVMVDGGRGMWPLRFYRDRRAAMKAAEHLARSRR